MLPALKPRRYERVGLRSGPFVAWQGPAGCSVSRVATLGMGGLFIAAAEPAGIGEGIKMVFQIPGGEVRARAMVRNSHPGKGMGVEFTSMRAEDRARLHRLLSKLLVVLPGKRPN
ncbi:MAG TPA: PilZ domain-containing protein [Rugosimonospora sp.]|nr:PilZ domain-containing protein [Rugosimonospora sp.]